MYYFILEQPKNRGQSNLQNKIVATLEDLQIIGELSKANPIQKPEELCEMGLKKGYNTIVVVGSDTVINNLAAIIAKNGATLGIIPTDPKSSFYSLIGCSNWEEACKALPKRRLETFDMGKVAADRYFLTYVKILSPKRKKPSQVTIKFNDYDIEVPALEIIITNGVLAKSKPEVVKNTFSDNLLDIYITTKVSKEKSSIFSFFKKEEEKPKFSSLFHARRIKIIGKEEILDIVSPDQKILTKTPCEISIVPKTIKIIIKKTGNVDLK